MPFSITRYFGGEERVWNVYSREEADKKGLEYVAWDEAEPGDWGLSDDGYVARCVRVNGPYDHASVGERYQYTYPFAQAWTSQELLFEPRREAGVFTGTSTRTWIEVELSRTRAQRVIKAYALLKAKQGHVTEKQIRTLGRMYRPDHAIPEASMKRLLKQQETKDMVAKEIAQILADKEVDEHTVIDMYLETYQHAKETDHTGTMKGVADRFAEMLRMDEHDEAPEAPTVEWSHLDDADEPAALPDADANMEDAPTTSESDLTVS